VIEEESEAQQPGNVIRTDPAPGNYPKDQRITLYIAKLPATTTEARFNLLRIDRL